MKIGILTFHHTTNYGATLQAYALWSIIKRHGYDVEIIDYQPPKAVDFYQNEIEQILGKGKVNQFLNKPLKYKYRLIQFRLFVKRLKMSLFMNSRMKLSTKRVQSKAELINLELSYDLIICGSDQVWCIDSYRGFDPSFFLDFVESYSCRKVSYAASFGNTEHLGEHRDSICQLVSDFDAISVRDSNSLRLIQQECNKPAVRVLDPTFLIDYQEFKFVPKFKKRYLLLYFHGNLNKEEQNFIKSIANRHKLAIVSVGKPITIAHSNLISAGFVEWLGLLRRASYVVTNTYHGTIFSIKFKKQFTVLGRVGKQNKINDLLEHLALENRILSKIETNSTYQQSLEIDYSLVDKTLEKEILSSKAYLLEVLGSKQVESKQIADSLSGT